MTDSEFQRPSPGDSPFRLKSQFIDHVGAIVFATDPDGDVIYWGPNASRYLGWADSDTVGRSALLLAPDNLREECQARFEHVRQFRTWNGACGFLQADGGILETHTHIDAILDPGQQILGYVITAFPSREGFLTRNVVPRHAASREAQLMEVIGTIVDTLLEQHADVRMLVRAVSSAVLRNAGSLAGGQLLHQLAVDLERGGRILQAVRALLDYREFARSRLSLHELITDPKSPALLHAGECGVGVDLDLRADRSEVLGNGRMLRRAVLELVKNAVEAVSCRADRPRISIRTQLHLFEVITTVTDDGPGLKPEIAAAPFNPLVTTKPGRDGLGLTLAESIIRGHYGRIWHSREPGRGASFSFALPLVKS